MRYRKMKGFTLIEILLVIGVIMLMSIIKIRDINQENQDLQAKIIAGQLQTVAEATNAFLVLKHNELSNFILRKGYHLKVEKNNYKAWQRGWFGRTILNKAPGMFESILKRKAGNAGGSVEFIDPFKPKFSQFCHKCSSYHKKTLSERVHMCNGEPVAQRDLYSAFLIYHYDIKANKHRANEENFKAFKKQTINFKGFHEKNYANNFSMQGMGTVLSNKTHNEAYHCDKLTSVLDNSNPPLASMGESVLPKVLKNVNINFPH